MKKAKTGSTLIELCLVIALSSVVFAMVASFSSLVYFRSHAIQDQQKAVDQVDDFRNRAYGWLRNIDRSEYVYAIDEFGTDVVVSFTDAGNSVETHTLAFNGESKLLQIDSVNVPVKYTCISSAVFGLEKNESSGKYLLTCTITYKYDPEDENEEEKTLQLAFSTNSDGGAS